jgi:hypothetical protein
VFARHATPSLFPQAVRYLPTRLISYRCFRVAPFAEESSFKHEMDTKKWSAILFLELFVSQKQSSKKIAEG